MTTNEDIALHERRAIEFIEASAEKLRAAGPWVAETDGWVRAGGYTPLGALLGRPGVRNPDPEQAAHFLGIWDTTALAVSRAARVRSDPVRPALLKACGLAG